MYWNRFERLWFIRFYIDSSNFNFFITFAAQVIRVINLGSSGGGYSGKYKYWKKWQILLMFSKKLSYIPLSISL